MADLDDLNMDRRRFHGVVAGGLFAAVIGARALPGAVEPDVEQDVVEGVMQLSLESQGQPIELRRELDAGTFVLAGVTWAPDGVAPEIIQARTRVGDDWSGWSELEVDADTSDEAAARPGTAPLIAPGADAVEVRVFPTAGGELPADLRLDLVSDDPLPTDAAMADVTNAAYVQDGAGGAVQADPVLLATASRPTIRSRAQWGADETLRQNYGESIQYGQVIGAFVHHTAGTNSYSSSEVPAILRGIYRYHVVSRNFYDIGYNILVDRFGRLWEGAYGGLDKAVVAAHTQYYNSRSFGISAIGNYSSKSVESGVVSALIDAIAWKFSVHGVEDPDGTAWYSGSNASSKRRIAGHRDTKATACPGNSLYAKLPTLRSAVTRRVMRASTLTMDAPSLVSYGERTTLTVSWRAGSDRLTGKVNLQRRKGGRWEHVRQFSVSGGEGSTVITPGSDNSYRLRASTCTSSDIDLSHPAGTSNTVSIRLRRPEAPDLRLSAPSSVSYGARTRLSVTWTAGGRGVTGKVNLQRRRGSGWEHVRQFSVSGGQGSTIITPGGDHSYRLRASTASSPSNVPTKDPEGTSNTISITIR